MSIISGMNDTQILQLAHSPGGSAALEKHIQTTLFDNIHAAPVSAAPPAKRGRKPSAKPAIEPPPTAIKPSKPSPRKAKPLAEGQPTASTKPRKASGGKAGKRSPEELAALKMQIVQYIKAHPGERTEDIGKGMGVDTDQIKSLIKKLVDGAALTTTGQKRATRYEAA